MLGNQATQRLFESGMLQAKLRVSQPGDADEQEADRAVEQIVSRKSYGSGPVLQRKCACGGSCSKCQEEEQTVHRKAVGPLSAFPFSIQRAAADEPVRQATEATEGAHHDQAKHPGESAHSVVVEDNAPSLAPGQMRKTEFLSLLQSSTCATADAVLESVGHTTKGCPYIKKWLGHYKDQSAAHLTRAMHKYAPETARARSAHEAIALVNHRVQRAALSWAKTGKVSDLPEGMQAEMVGGGGFLGALSGFAHSKVGGAVLGFLGGSREHTAGGNAGRDRAGIGGARMQMKSRDGAAAGVHDAAAVKEQLGSGHSLDGRVQSQMSSAFGYDFSGVRVHTDAKAGELSGQLSARAFTIGNDVAFAGGEYKPGTLVGDALIAHELAHVVQQGGGKQTGTAQSKNADLNNDSSLEQDADRSAVGAVVSTWTGTKKGLAEIGVNALPRLKSGLKLQRCNCNKKDAKAADFHADAKLPEAGTITAIQGELNPTSTVGGVATAWDGHQTGPVLTAAQALARTALKTELTQKLNDHLAANMPDINVLAAQRRLPVAAFEGAGKGAKRVVDRHFGQFTAAAAFTSTQETTKRTFQFKASNPGKTLFDANDPAQRTAAGIPVDADDVASWIAETDTNARAVQAAHHFNKNRSAEESDFLKTKILDPFVAARKPDLKKYDLFGFALTLDKVVVPTAVDPGFPDVPGVGGEPSPAERATKWSNWKVLVHEYLHTRTHPTFTKAARGNRTLIEGFTELFTKEVLLDEIPKAPADAALRKEVEGGDFSPPTAAMIGPYDPGSYKDYLEGAERLRDTAIGGPGGKAAVRAAYFLGHVEYLGLDPTGAVAVPAVPGSNDLITVPAGITTLAALAKAANVSEATIRSANPGLPAALPAQVHVPGATDHVVVTAKNIAGPPSPKSESKSQIAAQHGISEKDLERANPGLNWAALTEGQHILIPKH